MFCDENELFYWHTAGVLSMLNTCMGEHKQTLKIIQQTISDALLFCY